MSLNNIGFQEEIETTQSTAKYINAPKGTKFINELMDELPRNVLLHKGITGCGATTVAIESKYPTVIAVPCISMIECKIASHNHLIPLYGDISESIFKSRLQSASCPIIICTYDALDRLTAYFKDLSVELDKFMIVIDEAHRLNFDYSYRSEAVKKVLKCFKDFNSHTFITATPVSSEFILEELKDIPICKIIWDDSDIKKYTIHQQLLAGRTYDHVAKMIGNHIASGSSDNLYFFLNSVKAIANVINKLSNTISAENCNIVCRDDTSNREKLRDWEISSFIGKNIKKINFLTSKSFEGTDIHDPNGRTIVISDAAHEYSMLDISTQFIQIAGRIRNTKNLEILHICNIDKLTNNPLRYSNYNEYNDHIEYVREETLRIVEAYNAFPKYLRDRLKTDDLFCSKDKNGNLQFDNNKVKQMLYTYFIMNGYKNIKERYSNCGINYISERVGLVENIPTQPKKFLSLKEGYLKHQELLASKNSDIEAQNIIDDLLIDFPLILEINNWKLDIDSLANCEWKASKIREKINKLKFRNNPDLALKEVVQNRFRLNEKYTAKYLKESLQKIYDEVGANRIAKASDISFFYNVRSTRLGTKTGYELLMKL
jgi:hypothetical protein